MRDPARLVGAQLAQDAADADLAFLWERAGWPREHRETKLLSGRRAVIFGAGGIGRSIYRALNRAGLSVRCVARPRGNDGELGIASLAELPTCCPRRISSFWPGH